VAHALLGAASTLVLTLLLPWPRLASGRSPRGFNQKFREEAHWPRREPQNRYHAARLPRPASVRRRLFSVVDYQDGNGSRLGFQLQAKLLAQQRRERGEGRANVFVARPPQHTEIVRAR